MKKIYYLLIIALFGVASCQETIFDENVTQEADFTIIPIPNIPVIEYDGDPIILGRRLDNPYSLSNMRLAFHNLLPEMSEAGIEEEDIVTTHFYVRFRPDNEEELQTIKDRYSNFDIYEYPLDYELSGRVSYHDPEIPDSLPTYQYAAIDSVSWRTIPLPLNVDYEIIERLFIPDEDVDIEPEVQMCTTRSSSYYDAIESLVNESMRLTGNIEEEDIPENGMMASNSTWYPSGRITAYDDIVDGQVPLEGVKVRARRWFTTRSATTDANGYFSFNKGFKDKVNYSIVWDGPKWNIRDGQFIQAYYNGPKKKGAWNLEITDDGYKSIRYAAIHRAVYRMKLGNTYGLSRINDLFCTNICYKHESGDGVLGDYNREWGLYICSDIRIFGKKRNGSFCKIHEIVHTTFHELGHAAHCTNNIYNYYCSDSNLLESWASFVGYYLSIKEYQDLGCHSGPFNILMDIDAGHTITMCYEPDNQINLQLREVKSVEDNSDNYLPLFIDLNDPDNQWLLYTIYPDVGVYDRNYFPKDYIRIIPAEVLENFAFNSLTLLETKPKLEIFYRNNTATMNTEYNLTQENINLMYELYENL